MNKYREGASEAMQLAEKYTTHVEDDLRVCLRVATALATAVVLALHEIADAIRSK